MLDKMPPDSVQMPRAWECSTVVGRRNSHDLRVSTFDPRYITGEELYKAVWVEPNQKLAKGLGISEVGVSGSLLLLYWKQTWSQSPPSMTARTRR